MAESVKFYCPSCDAYYDTAVRPTSIDAIVDVDEVVDFDATQKYEHTHIHALGAFRCVECGGWAYKKRCTIILAADE
jgi:hypothetical protein